MMSLIVVGSVNVDLVVRGEQLPRPGETVLGGKFFQACGGKGANQAVAAARAALKPNAVLLVGAVGDDTFGRQSLAEFQAVGLRTEFVQVVSGAATGIAVILVDEQGENLISVASGANALLTPEDINRLPEQMWREARVLVTNLELPLPTVLAALQKAKQHGLLTVLNPAPANKLVCTPEWAACVDVLTPNESEASLLSGFPIVDSVSAHQSLQELRARGYSRVCLTRGPHGVLICDQTHEISELPALSVTAVDATAAGDCFTGVLAVGLLEGMDLLSAARRGIAAAGISVTRAGAQPSLPMRSEIAMATDLGGWPGA